MLDSGHPLIRSLADKLDDHDRGSVYSKQGLRKIIRSCLSTRPVDTAKAVEAAQKGTIDRRQFLKLLGLMSGAGAASAVTLVTWDDLMDGTSLTGMQVASEDSHKIVEIGSGESQLLAPDDYSGKTIENMLIDVTREKADVHIRARSSGGWTIRNVGVKGSFDIGDDSVPNPNTGGFSQVMRCEVESADQQGVIDSVYLGDGAMRQVDKSAMNTGPAHAGHIDFSHCYVAGWTSNALYCAGFGNDQISGSSDGTMTFNRCYMHDNNIAHLRLAADGTEVVGCVIHNTNNVRSPDGLINSRGIFTGYGARDQTIHVRESHFDVTSGNTNGGNSAIRSPDSKGSCENTCSTVHVYSGCQMRGRLTDQPPVEIEDGVGNSPSHDPPEGVPMSAEEAANCV